MTPSVLVPSAEMLSQTAVPLVAMILGISSPARFTRSAICRSVLGSPATLPVISMYSLGAIIAGRGGSPASFFPSVFFASGGGLAPVGSMAWPVAM